MKMILVSKGGSSELEVCVSVGGGCMNSMKPLWNCDRSAILKTLSGSATIKRTVSDCQVEVLSGAVKIKLLPGSITIKNTARQSHD